MSVTPTLQKRNEVLTTMAELIASEKIGILEANKKDLENYQGDDIAMRDRLKIDSEKMEGMILSLQQLGMEPDPLGMERFQFDHENGLHISNRTAPFGTVLIIYESRPDVTIEATAIAFKSGNVILLKGGKESLNSNLALVNLWYKALQANGLSIDWVDYLVFDRAETRAFLERPSRRVDLIVPRGGEQLIAFVKAHASCPVIVSGRGNNFVYVDAEADTKMAMDIIVNAKTTKISACNALDKVLIAATLPGKQKFIQQLIRELQKSKVQVLTDNALGGIEGTKMMENESVWYEEFLDYKIVLGQVGSTAEAIAMINRYGGGHSAAIITGNTATAAQFMDETDTAAVYHNASTRFTDGGQFGLGGELAISTDKLHQRGPIGLQHLVTNKWYVQGNGQIR